MKTPEVRLRDLRSENFGHGNRHAQNPSACTAKSRVLRQPQSSLRKDEHVKQPQAHFEKDRSVPKAHPLTQHPKGMRTDAAT